jgi:hypothetical protein
MEAIDKFRKVILEGGDKAVLDEALRRFAIVQERERHSRELAIEDKISIEAEGGSWADSGISYTANNILGGAADNAPEPPRYQIDRVTPVLEQALSDQRQNEIQIQVRGVRSSGSADDTMNGLIKNIEVVSDASYCYDNAFDETQKCGYGGWQIVTEYAEDGFDQEVRIRPIKDAASSLYFGPSDLYTKEDALYAFVIWYEDMEEFRANYPDSQLVDVPNDMLTSHSLINSEWFDSASNTIRMAAYWRKKPVKREIVKMTDGSVYDADKLEAVLDELAAQNPPITIEMNDGKEMRRMVDAYKIERFIISGAEVLKGPQAWPGKYIPLIPEYGVETTIQGRQLVRGRVRKTKDAARVFNYAISGAVKQAAISPQDLLLLTGEQADGHVTEIENLNVSDAAALLYNHIDGQPAPFRTQSRQLDQALIGIAQMMAENISATVGGSVGSGNDGTAIDRRSGEAIMQGQAVNEKGNAIYMTNHIRSVAYGGKVLADLLPRIKSGESQERIISPDGSTKFVAINKTEKDVASGKDVILNDLSATKYDVIPDVGPAYASKRQQGSAQLQSLSEKNELFGRRPDLIVKGLDLGDGGEMYDSLRKDLIMSGAVEPTDEEREEFKIDEVEAMKQQLMPQLLEQLTQDANIRLINANSAALEAQAQASLSKTEVDQLRATSDSQSNMMKDITEAYKAIKTQLEGFEIQTSLGLGLSRQDEDNLVTAGEVAESAQQEIQQGPNSQQIAEYEQTVQSFEEPVRFDFNIETGGIDERS